MVDTGQADDRVDELFAPVRGGAGRGWYETIDNEDERKFVDLVVERAIESGKMPNVTGMTRILNEDYGDEITVNPVRKYVRKRLRDAGVEAEERRA